MFETLTFSGELKSTEREERFIQIKASKIIIIKFIYNFFLLSLSVFAEIERWRDGKRSLIKYLFSLEFGREREREVFKFRARHCVFRILG